MKYATTLLLVVLFILFTASPAATQDIKPGLVDYYTLIQRMPEIRAAEQRVQNFRQRKIDEILAKRQEIELEAERYQQRASVLSDEAKETEEERLVGLQTELNELQTRAEQEIYQEQQRLMRPVLEQVQESINRVAEESGVNFVLKTTALDGTRVILYITDEAREKYDITDAIMHDLGI